MMEFEFLVYSETENFNYISALESIPNSSYRFIDELPERISFSQVLIAQLNEVSYKFLNQVKLRPYRFVISLDNFDSKLMPFMTRAGGCTAVYNNMSDQEFLSILSGSVIDEKMLELSNSLARNEYQLLKTIFKACNGEKKIISDMIFGATSENTLDVNLTRLRKKLKDPDVGNDFFRIVSKDGRLYLVNAYMDYAINPIYLTDESQEV